MLRTFASAALASIVLAPLPAAGQHQHAAPHQHAAAGHEQLGTVDFATSCTAAARPDFNRAVALLHSFEFGDAIKGFTAALAKDPSCAMAEWGIAMSRWGNPFNLAQRAAGPAEGGPGGRRSGQGPQAGDAARAGLRRRRRDALRQAPIRSTSARASSPTATRWRRSRRRTRPTSKRRSSTRCRSPARTRRPTRPTPTCSRRPAILEGLIEKYPQHPGLAHYIIHSYDVPALADRALVAARRYATIAPSAPHALHMPSHTFTRVGSWQESIDTNVASAKSAKALGSVAEELHAMDYQAYAALQTGQDAAARALLAELPGIKARFDPEAIGGAAPGSAGLFALASIPARYALERGDWKAAAALTPEPNRFLYPEAQTWYAKALGAARSGDAATTKAAIAELTRIRDELTAKKEAYWAEQAEIQRRSATAWLALVEGRNAEALAEMMAAADLEDKTEKAAVTPGPLAPARELVGEMLLQMDKPAGGAAGVRGDPEEGAEPVPRAVGRDPCGDARRSGGPGPRSTPRRC